VQRSAGPARALKFGIGGAWRAALALDAHDARAARRDDEPSFQFHDHRLARLVRQLNDWRERGHTRLGALDIEHLQQATLACWAEHQATGRQVPPQHDAALPEPTRRVVAEVVDDTLPSDLTVQELARLTGYTAAQFLRRFKATFRMPPHRYILARRVERAKQLMQDTELTLTAIAQQLGFASHAHFSTAFKLRTGTTPSEFRRRPAPQGRAVGAPCECR
jgi:AraC family transcriptional regulator